MTSFESTDIQFSLERPTFPLTRKNTNFIIILTQVNGHNRKRNYKLRFRDMTISLHSFTRYIHVNEANQITIQ